MRRRLEALESKATSLGRQQGRGSREQGGPDSEASGWPEAPGRAYQGGSAEKG